MESRFQTEADEKYYWYLWENVKDWIQRKKHINNTGEKENEETKLKEYYDNY